MNTMIHRKPVHFLKPYKISIYMSNSERNLSFALQYKFFTLLSSLGTYPPGIEEIIKSSTILWILKIYSLFVVFLGFIYCVIMTVAIFTATVPPTVMIMMIRRYSGIVFTLMMAIYFAVPKKQKAVTCLIERFENSMLNNYDRKWVLFRENAKIMWNVYSIGGGSGVFFVALTLIPYYLNRHAPGASAIFVVHDPDEWYHFILLTWLIFLFITGNFGSYTVQVYSQIIIVMGITQLKLLQEHLHRILSKITVDESGVLITEKGKLTQNDRKIVLIQLRKDIITWIQDHKLVLCWIEDSKEFVEYVSTLKLGFLTVYMGTVIFTIKNSMEEKEYTDIVTIICYCIGIVPLTFWQSRLAEEIHDISYSLWESLSDTPWYLYPKDVTQLISIIGYQCQSRPVTIRTFYLFKDNSVTYLTIIHTAYKALSFLLRMDFGK